MNTQNFTYLKKHQNLARFCYILVRIEDTFIYVGIQTLACKIYIRHYRANLLQNVAITRLNILSKIARRQ